MARSQPPAAGVTLFGKVQDAETKAAPPRSSRCSGKRNSAFVGGRLTNEQGAFTFSGLKKGSYVLVVRSIGYQPIRQRVLIGELRAFLDLGAIQLIKETHTLGDVRVTANADAVASTTDKKDVHGIRVTGLSAQYESTYEVAPRQAADIVVK